MITGLSYGFHDAAIAVIDGNQILECHHAERFSKIKNDHNLWNEFNITGETVYYERPFLKNTRAIGRYGMFAALPLGVLTVVALRGILHGSRLANKASLASVMLLGALVVESLPTGSVFPYEEPLRSRYEKVATLIKPGDPFVELPCHDSGHLETIKRLMEQMNGALYHHGNLVVGYSGRSSPENATLIHLDQRLAAGTLAFGEMLRHLRQLNVKSVLINTDRYNANVTEQIVETTIREAGYKEAPVEIPDARVLRLVD